eukprot:scaffold32329_cov30-Tisochrysis_lutea.AAC.1
MPCSILLGLAAMCCIQIRGPKRLAVDSIGHGPTRTGNARRPLINGRLIFAPSTSSTKHRDASPARAPQL